VFVDDRECVGEEFEINRAKWMLHWQKFNWEAELVGYRASNMPYIERHLGKMRSGTDFLEIGGGPSFLCFELAARGVNVVSVDLDLSVLRVARDHFSRQNRIGHFVQCDINRLPFKDKTFSASSGIGVLEHSRGLIRPIQELHRITRDAGLTFQTVPYLSLLTLFHNTLRFGTAPNIPGLRQLTEFVHIRLLRMRYMKYGYEQSFTYHFLRKVFRQVGFRSVEVGFYDYDQTLFRHTALVSRILRRLITLQLLGATPFADIAYVTAIR
jgi:ubiquinone/menaquinone biosynthesis C-methylase UbiE